MRQPPTGQGLPFARLEQSAGRRQRLSFRRQPGARSDSCWSGRRASAARERAEAAGFRSRRRRGRQCRAARSAQRTAAAARKKRRGRVVDCGDARGGCCRGSSNALTGGESQKGRQTSAGGQQAQQHCQLGLVGRRGVLGGAGWCPREDGCSRRMGVWRWRTEGDQRQRSTGKASSAARACHGDMARHSRARGSCKDQPGGRRRCVSAGGAEGGGAAPLCPAWLLQKDVRFRESERAANHESPPAVRPPR